MNYNSVAQDKTKIILQQMGAKVKSLHGVQTYVHFYLENNVELHYVYNTTKNMEFYLQRIKPYPYGAGVFPSEEAILEFIGNDLAKFSNAAKSSVYDLFIENSNKLNNLVQSIELLFLENNVPLHEMKELTTLLTEVDNKIIDLTKNTPKI